MIDTATSGIKKVFRIQRDKYFPMPDYDLTTSQQVSVRLYGKTLNEAYVHILYNNPDLPLDTVLLLDRVQKGQRISKEAADNLRKQKLIEGRYPKIYPSAAASKAADEEAKYIRNKAFDNQYYQDLIVQYLRTYKKADKKKIRELLLDKLPDILTDTQKNQKITDLLTAMRKKGIITTDSPNKQKSCWILK